MPMTRRDLDELLSRLERDLPRTMTMNNGDFFLQAFTSATDFIVDLADPADESYVRARAKEILAAHGLVAANDAG